MSDLDRVLTWFDSGALLRPDATIPSTVSLSRVLAQFAGVDVTLNEPERAVADAIGPAEHVVFVLADGLGMDLVESRSPDSIMQRQLAMELRSVFPSSTAPALTSLATGMWPAEHGLTAWHIYLPGPHKQVTALPYVERFTGKSASEAGVSPDVLFPSPVLATRHTRDSKAYLPRRIADSVYSRYILGGRPARTYDKLYQGADTIVARVRSARLPSYTYLYYPGIDAAEHEHGPGSSQVELEVARLEQALRRLAQGLEGRARIVVSADHGQIEVAHKNKLYVKPNDEISELLVTPPSGEGLVPMFHCLQGTTAEFARRFRHRFGEHFALLSTDEVESLQLLGPGALSRQTRARLGDYLALSSQGEVLVYSLDKEVAALKGFHGGLSPSEVRIPLIVI